MARAITSSFRRLSALQSENFTCMKLKGNVAEHILLRRAGPYAALLLPFHCITVNRFSLPAYHQAYERCFIEPRPRPGRNELSVAHDRNGVRNPENLIHFVGNIDDADAIVLSFPMIPNRWPLPLSDIAEVGSSMMMICASLK